MPNRPKFETLCIHAGREIDPHTRAVVPPIHMATTFERGADGGYPAGFSYARDGNPNRLALEECLAALEGGAAAACFASGMAAALAVFQALPRSTQVVATAGAYYGVVQQLREVVAPWGIGLTLIDTGDPEALNAAITNDTSMVWLETPSNPLLTVSDIAAVSELAHANGALLACDNTVATPAGQNPVAHGADLVMHSTTKYIGGHSDVTGGVVVTAEPTPFFDKVRAYQSLGGSVPGPFDCWLLLRSVASLPCRFAAQTANADKVAAFLRDLPGIERVCYPGLPDHPGHDIAARQMKSFGALLSVLFEGGRDAALEAVSRVQLFTQATSLGGVESLIEHRASAEGPTSRTPQNLLRISIGLENVHDLIADLDQAFAGG